jgi:hypothetical protein
VQKLVPLCGIGGLIKSARTNAHTYGLFADLDLNN